MAARNSSSEDIRKLHAEVTQLVSQRILLATLSTTIVGAAIAWAIPRGDAHAKEFDAVPFIASMTLFLVLSSLALLSHHLRRQLRVITTYLEVVCESPWEQHWLAYRNSFPYPGYSKPLAWHFMVLGAIALLFPYVISAASPKAGAPLWQLFGPAVLFVVYEVSVLVLGVSSGVKEDEKCRENWKAVALGSGRSNAEG